MAMAANLSSAATLSYSQVSLTWYALTLKAKFAAFITDVSPLLEDSKPNDRTVGNWLIPMQALSTAMSSSLAAVTEAQFNGVVEYLYRFCYAAAFAQAQLRITNAQAVALLAAWNARFGT